jgi:hypothetical protein
MYVLINAERMEVLYRCEKVETLRALANIELSHIYVSIFEESDPASYSLFSTHGLQQLFKSLTGGTDPHSHNVEYLTGQVIRLCQSSAPSDVDGFEAIVQSLQIKAGDQRPYLYRKGRQTAEPLGIPYNPPPIVGNWQAAQALPIPSASTAPHAPPAPAQAQPWAIAPAVTPPKYAPPWAKP